MLSVSHAHIFNDMPPVLDRLSALPHEIEKDRARSIINVLALVLRCAQGRASVRSLLFDSASLRSFAVPFAPLFPRRRASRSAAPPSSHEGGQHAAERAPHTHSTGAKHATRGRNRHSERMACRSTRRRTRRGGVRALRAPLTFAMRGGCVCTPVTFGALPATSQRHERARIGSQHAAEPRGSSVSHSGSGGRSDGGGGGHCHRDVRLVCLCLCFELELASAAPSDHHSHGIAGAAGFQAARNTHAIPVRVARIAAHRDGGTIALGETAAHPANTTVIPHSRHAHISLRIAPNHSELLRRRETEFRAGSRNEAATHSWPIGQQSTQQLHAHKRCCANQHQLAVHCGGRRHEPPTVQSSAHDESRPFPRRTHGAASRASRRWQLVPRPQRLE